LLNAALAASEAPTTYLLRVHGINKAAPSACQNGLHAAAAIG
jgi:hypothetical protein